MYIYAVIKHLHRSSSVKEETELKHILQDLSLVPAVDRQPGGQRVALSGRSCLGAAGHTTFH